MLCLLNESEIVDMEHDVDAMTKFAWTLQDILTLQISCSYAEMGGVGKKFVVVSWNVEASSIL